MLQNHEATRRPKAWSAAYRAASREADLMSDGELARAYGLAVQRDNDLCTAATAGRERALYHEMEHRDCWV